MLRELNEVEMGMVSGGAEPPEWFTGPAWEWDWAERDSEVMAQLTGPAGYTGGGGFGFGPYPNELSGNYYDQQPETPIAEDPQPTDENCRFVYDMATIEVTRNGVTEQVPYPVEICD